MIIIKIKQNESIDRALKRYKSKFKRIKMIDQLRKNKEFTKPSVRRRKQKQKAIYLETKNRLEND